MFALLISGILLVLFEKTYYNNMSKFFFLCNDVVRDIRYEWTFNFSLVFWNLLSWTSLIYYGVIIGRTVTKVAYILCLILLISFLYLIEFGI